jgi:hypothetical protein
MTKQQILDFYLQPNTMTDVAQFAPWIADLPDEVSAIIKVVQGTVLHEHWASAYGVTLSDERRSQSHLRSAGQMLSCLDNRPLTTVRSLEERVIGNCRHFSVLTVALLRTKGIPARARCGFGMYFTPGFGEDHWLVEYWHEAQARWVRVDAQIDDFQAERMQIKFDRLDVPHDQFVIAGDAWAHSRAGKADPTKFGFSFLKESGYWFIAGNILRDFAALNNLEMLPWDVWGAMPDVGEVLNDAQLARFDQLAALTRTPDDCFDELQSTYVGDEQVRVAPVVLNAVLNRREAWAA